MGQGAQAAKAATPTMSHWHFVIIPAGAILVAVLLYVALRWRKAPKVFKAMYFVMIASLVAGGLAGVWGVKMLDTWTGSAATGAASTPGVRAGAPGATPKPRVAAPAVSPALRVGARATSPAPRVAVPRATSSAARATPTAAPGTGGGIPVSYVAQALIGSTGMGMLPGGLMGWDDVDRDCHLGYFQATSAACRAAALAMRGWGDTGSVPSREVVEFCKAGYLGNAFALCWWAEHGGFPSHVVSLAPMAPPRRGIPEGDLRHLLRDNNHVGALDNAPALMRKSKPRYAWQAPPPPETFWGDVKSSCAKGTFARASPLCAVEALNERKHDPAARVPYAVVASFCDLRLLRGAGEVCRAAYRCVESAGGCGG